MTVRFTVTYLVQGDAASIAARAEAIAVEQSVEMPVAAIESAAVLRDVVGRVEDIADQGNGEFAVRIALATATVGSDAGQFLNMLFGNTSLHADVVLQDVEVPATLVTAFGGPQVGIPGLRARIGVHGRAFTGSALKPQGMPPDALATLAGRLAEGGLDFIKDDHGLADQGYSPFAARVTACAAAIAAAARRTGHPTRYIPSITGNLDQMRAQLRLAREHGIDCAMVVPMLSGVANLQAVRAAFPDIALFAHPSFGGAARVAPELLLGKLMPLFGADAVIFPNHGGRFGYTPATCRRLAATARAAGVPALPVPAGGMTLDRTAELLDFYGQDTMLLIGGNLLMARARIAEEAAAFARAVAQHPYAQDHDGH